MCGVASRRDTSLPVTHDAVGTKRKGPTTRSSTSKLAKITGEASISITVNIHSDKQQLVKAEDQGDSDGVTDEQPESSSRPQALLEGSSSSSSACEFCKSNPRMQQQRPCNWYKVDKDLFECSNCTEYRHESNNPCHVCCVQKKGQSKVKIAFPNYADGHPYEFPQVSACKACLSAGIAHLCDVDPFLGFACSHCEARAQKKGIKNNNTAAGCMLRINSVPYTMKTRPRLRQGSEKWFRHECDICSNLAMTGKEGCSWLRNRKAWGAPCERCKDNSMSCMSQAFLVAHPQTPMIPTRWTVSNTLGKGHAELRAKSPYRASCKACQAGGHHCRAMAQYLDYSCNWCFQIGITCEDSRSKGKTFDLFDLSRVGFGNFMPFSTCAQCVAAGRNCDRQRPCDSCVGHGEGDKCDPYKNGKSNPLSLNCMERRYESPPGPLYYLGLGYGPKGVDDVKDGTKLEHWIGPAFPLYAMSMRAGSATEPADTNQRAVVALAMSLRHSLLPGGIPPTAIPANGSLRNVRVDEITAKQLRVWIRTGWPDAKPMAEAPDYAAKILDGRSRRKDAGKSKPEDTSKPRRRPRQGVTSRGSVRNQGSTDADDHDLDDKQGPDAEMYQATVVGSQQPELQDADAGELRHHGDASEFQEQYDNDQHAEQLNYYGGQFHQNDNGTGHLSEPQQGLQQRGTEPPFYPNPRAAAAAAAAAAVKENSVHISRSSPISHIHQTQSNLNSIQWCVAGGAFLQDNSFGLSMYSPRTVRMPTVDSTLLNMLYMAPSQPSPESDLAVDPSLALLSYCISSGQTTTGQLPVDPQLQSSP